MKLRTLCAHTYARGIMTKRLPAWLALAAAALIGAMTATQARINGVLGVRLDDGIAAGTISFGMGLALLVVLAIVLPVGRRGATALWRGVRARRVPWWMLLAGAAGALTVITQGVTAAVIGVSFFTVGIVAGQAVIGLVLDRIGYSPAGVVAITAGRVVGGALALVAVGIAVIGGQSHAPVWMLVLPFITGVGVAWQQATNGRLRQRVGSAFAATLMNFITGTVLLLIALGVAVLVKGPPNPLPTEPWLYLGAFLGMTYIAMAAVLVAHTGVLLLGLGTVVGQLVASVVIDLIWPAAQAPGLWQSVLMVLLALASVLVALIRPRRSPR